MPKNPNRDYKKEAAWEDSPEQVKRRVARNRVRRKAMREGRVHKGDGKELGHINAPRTGSLDNVPARVITKKANRRDQPKRS